MTNVANGGVLVGPLLMLALGLALAAGAITGCVGVFALALPAMLGAVELAKAIDR